MEKKNLEFLFLATFGGLELLGMRERRMFVEISQIARDRGSIDIDMIGFGTREEVD